jgi:hypothetical protein
MPRAIVAEADVDAPRSIVAGHEPPNVRVIIPARLHEDIIHAFHDAVSVHPNVVTIAVRPIPVDPDGAGTKGHRLLDHDGLRGRWCLLGSRDGLGLLNDDDGFAVDLLGCAVFGFDDHIGRRIGRPVRLPLSHVAIV